MAGWFAYGQGSVYRGVSLLDDRAACVFAGSGLTLELGGEDRTQATQQLTQALIDATFGTAYLPGAVFMTHGSVQLLLQATDKEFRCGGDF